MYVLLESVILVIVEIAIPAGLLVVYKQISPILGSSVKLLVAIEVCQVEPTEVAV